MNDVSHAPCAVVAATSVHVDAIATIEAEAFARPDGSSNLAELLARLGREMEDAAHGHWVALVPPTDVVAGYLQALWLPDALDILSVATAPSFRRRGIGAALVAAALAAGRARPVGEVTLEVAARNTPARALYLSMGFVEQRIRRGYYPARGAIPPDDAVCMACVM